MNGEGHLQPQDRVNLTIVSGLSGAGKSQAMHYFEDAGYFCIDNLPPALLPKFVELCKDTHGKIKSLAVGIDTRGGEFFQNLFDALATVKELGFTYRILFLDATDEVLVRRFSETRRRHPLSSGGRILDDIQYERRTLSELRESADVVINTSDLTARELYEEIRRFIEHDSTSRKFPVVIVSFGFKHGVPLDCDLMFDVRFLPNPYYLPEMKNLTGIDEQVYHYVTQSELGAEFGAKLLSFIEYLIPHFIQEGKSRLQIAIGCTGGRHRSVAFAEFLYREMQKDHILLSRRHRDLDLK
ncbi:MAG TPA: RNase adapter RapZ [Candidatus Ozemobacteraceae bacterium]|nr:RNase adapter RapZ [Candidatus Ozemobacteraceae bacterium]